MPGKYEEKKRKKEVSSNLIDTEETVFFGGISLIVFVFKTELLWN